jgi:hypothetical protein
MANVFLWKVGDRVVYHTNLEAAAQLDGLSRQPDKTVTGEQFSEAGGLVRLINNKIVLGKTKQEETDDEVRKRIIEIDSRFDAIERAMVRPIMAHIKGNPATRDTEKLNALDAEAQSLRKERSEKVASLSVPL